MDKSAKSNYRNTTRLKSRKSLYTQYGYPETDIYREIFSAYKLNGNETILDIGCGFGDLLIRLRNEGHRGKLYGVDISEGMINEAKKNSKDLDIEFRVSKAEELAFEKESFDIIICKHSLYHFDLDKAVGEIERVIKQKGVLISTLNSYSERSRHYSEKYKNLISKELNHYSFVDTANNINFETYGNFFKNFLILKEVKLHRYVRLSESNPFVEYMSTFREFWDPIPIETEWYSAMEAVRSDINRIIREKGMFEEKANFGISILEKQSLDNLVSR